MACARRQTDASCSPPSSLRNNLKVIDTATNKVTDTIPLTGTPNQCAATPDGRFVGVPIRDGNSVDIVDMAEKRVVKVLPDQGSAQLLQRRQQ